MKYTYLRLVELAQKKRGHKAFTKFDKANWKARLGIDVQRCAEYRIKLKQA